MCWTLQNYMCVGAPGYLYVHLFTHTQGQFDRHNGGAGDSLETYQWIMLSTSTATPLLATRSSLFADNVTSGSNISYRSDTRSYTQGSLALHRTHCHRLSKCLLPVRGVYGCKNLHLQSERRGIILIWPLGLS